MSSGTNRRGRLLIIGGAERRDSDSEILRHFVAIAGGNEARVMVCAPATRQPTETLEQYRVAFSGLEVGQLWLEPMQDRQSCNSEDLVERLDRATAVFFTGGDQIRLTATVAGTEFGDRVKERIGHENLVVAGTSAGAAAMSSTMIVGGRDGGSVRKSDVRVGVGLGYLRDAIVDTHFNQRGRVNRLLSLFAQNSQILGVGIDEDTAIDVTLGEPMRVLGSGAVTIFDGRLTHSNAAEVYDDEILALSGVRLHVLPRGYGFDPKELKLLLPVDD